MPHIRLHENRIHGEPLFPFQYYRMTSAGGNIFVPCHWHDEIEIILIQKGTVELLLDDETLLLTEGDIVFINARQLHQYTGLDEKALYYAYVFSMNSLHFKEQDITEASFISPLDGHTLCFPTRLSPSDAGYENIRSLILKIIRSNEKQEEAYQLLTKAYLYEIIGLLSKNRQLRKQSAPDKRFDTCRGILLYIQKHYSEHITVPEISKSLCMSPNYFSAYFSSHFGRSFVDFLNHYRIERACVLLTVENLSVTQAALQTGFENISYFIKKFKEVTGTTPAKFRNQTHAISRP